MIISFKIVYLFIRDGDPTGLWCEWFSSLIHMGRSRFIHTCCFL